MKYTFAAIAGVVIIGVIVGVVFYQPYGECTKLSDNIKKTQKYIDGLNDKITQDLSDEELDKTLVFMQVALTVQEERLEKWRVSCKPLLT